MRLAPALVALVLGVVALGDVMAVARCLGGHFGRQQRRRGNGDDGDGAGGAGGLQGLVHCASSGIRFDGEPDAMEAPYPRRHAPVARLCRACDTLDQTDA